MWLTIVLLLATNHRVQGSLVTCAQSDKSITLDVRTRSSVQHFVVSQAPLPAEIARIVGAAYRVDGGCLAAGEQVRLTTDEQGTPYIIEVDGQASDLFGIRPWLVRQVFDRRSQPWGDVDRELFMVSRVLAHYNQQDGGSRSLWLYDRIDRALDTYTSASRASEMYEQFGERRQDIARTLGPVETVYHQLQHADAEPGVVLIKGLPYMVMHPYHSPFIGAWGLFASAVYAPRPGGLMRAYPR